MKFPLPCSCFKYWSFSNKVFLKIKSPKKKKNIYKITIATALHPPPPPIFFNFDNTHPPPPSSPQERFIGANSFCCSIPNSGHWLDGPNQKAISKSFHKRPYPRHCSFFFCLKSPKRKKGRRGRWWVWSNKSSGVCWPRHFYDREVWIENDSMQRKERNCLSSERCFTRCYSFFFSYSCYTSLQLQRDIYPRVGTVITQL